MAILLTATAEGRKGVIGLLQRLFQWRIGIKWYALALVLPLALQLAMSVLALLLGWIPTIQVRASSFLELIILGVLILILSAGEELGWRGYVLPRLLPRRPALFSAVLIGIPWGILHLGLIPGTGRPLLGTFLAPFGFSVVLTWLFIQTRGNLAMAILCHFGMNYFTFFNGGMMLAQVVWSQAIVTLVLALILIAVFGVELQRSPTKEPAMA
jgi:membrane protease YdiL (CAAX protease family)